MDAAGCCLHIYARNPKRLGRLGNAIRGNAAVVGQRSGRGWAGWAAAGRSQRHRGSERNMAIPIWLAQWHPSPLAVAVDGDAIVPPLQPPHDGSDTHLRRLVVLAYIDA